MNRKESDLAVFAAFNVALGAEVHEAIVSFAGGNMETMAGFAAAAAFTCGLCAKAARNVKRHFVDTPQP